MYEVELRIAGSEIPVGYALLEKLIEIIPDGPGYEQVLQRLALVGTTKVQEAIASREHIDEQTVQILLRSKQVNVLRPLLGNPRVQEAMTQWEAQRIANSNQPELLEVLAWNIGDFALFSPAHVLERLAADSDPRAYPLHRMVSATRLYFDAPKKDGFSIDQYAQEQGHFGTGKMITFKARVRGHLVRLLEETKLEAKQKLSAPDAEGWRLLTARLRDTWQLRWWVLAQEKSIEVIGPSGFRARRVKATSDG